MTLENLKTAIEYKNPIEELIIFKYSDSDFIAHQYVRTISNYTDSEVVLIDSLDTFKLSSSFLVEKTIYLYKCDEFKTDNERLKTYKNLFVICKSVDKTTKKLYSEYIIDLPKLEKWQILDYIYFNCPTVAKELEYMADKMTMYDIDNEISKISIFSKKKNELGAATFDEKELPKYVYASLSEDGSWNYLPKYTIFDFTTALLTGNKKAVNTILQYDIDIQPAALVQILYMQVKEIIAVILDKNATAETVGISNGKYWAIKHNYANMNKERLTYLLKFLTAIDKQVKIGKLGYDDQLLDLIIINFLGE